MKKILTFSIMLLFLLMTISSANKIYLEKQSFITIFDGKTLYVGGTGPGNYTKIQDAIDNASDGETVFVYDDSSPYYEYIIIDKSINLIGENKDTTIIDGENKIKQHILRITADEVTLKGFTIQDSYYGADEWFAGIIVYSNNNNIFGNVLTNNANGIIMNRASHNKIHENIVTRTKRNFTAIRQVKGGYNEIYNNTISEVGYGVAIHDSSCNKFYGNSFTQVKSAISITGHGVWFNKIYKNIISRAERGIVHLFSSFNFVYLNEIKSCNEYGFCMYHVKFTFIMKNNFIENSCSAYFLGKCFTNHWIRNYWDDWDKLGFYQIDGEVINLADPTGDYISVKQYDRFPKLLPYKIEV